MMASQALFDELPLLDLAKAATWTSSYGRAIKYFEMYAFRALKQRDAKVLLHNKCNDGDGFAQNERHLDGTAECGRR